LKTSKKETNDNDTLPAVNCFCGVKILLVPDVRLMSEAIEAHIKEKHMSKTVDSVEAEVETEKVREYLIMQVFDKASKNKF
jgi:hypothetical protein